MKDEKKVLEQYKEAKAVLLTTFPFVASLLNKARVILTEAVPTAAVDEKGAILINPGFFSSISPQDRVFVLAHETLHWAFLDHRRVGNRDRTAWNIAADAVNNEILFEVIRPSDRLREGLVDYGKVSALTGRPGDELREMTKEQIYELLPKVKMGSGDGGSGGKDPLRGDLVPGDLSGKGKVVQEGSGDIYNSDDLEEAMKRAIAEAEQMQKLRGTMPAGLARIVDELLRPKVPWKTLLKQALRDGLGRTSTQSWKKLSRRHKDFPGKRRLTTPTVWVGVDTSGSIGDKELQQFLTEVYGIAKAYRAAVVVVPWDAKIYEPTKITSPSQIKRVKIRGGGGTDPTEFLQYVAKHMRLLDAVVILSDGYIGNWSEYEKLARDVSAKASVCIFATTGHEGEWPGWKTIRVEL